MVDIATIRQRKHKHSVSNYAEIEKRGKLSKKIIPKILGHLKFKQMYRLVIYQGQGQDPYSHASIC